ncbi:ufm1-specific protease 2-like [Leucoraja erinacea]|uniref:ufm1-specific protease 2-like n=1 Tax=Leucoraja erinaceus TaxID=7782 RepID=UPI002456066C|nr:ufm1-specific protease 2-like [Leucoraja erinacea]
MGKVEDIGNLFIVHDKKSRAYYNMILPIDVVVFAQPEKPWKQLQDEFMGLITSQLSEMEQCIEKYADGKTIPIPQPFHFELPENDTLITVVYPGGVPEEKLEPERQELHTKLGLDNRPYFHRAMAYYFPSDDLLSVYIRNIHKYISLSDPGSFKGIYLVHGYYTYHHILEDHHNDIAWGSPFHCLKCVINWFRIQGYVSKPLPSVGDLQKILLYAPHEIIVESIEWIGSHEITGLLSYFGISADTMHVQKTPGNFLDQRKIAKHFIEHGTPVIISSQPQSYVLLGVAMSDALENSRYLIMDPDITGIYDMAKIIEKAIEWKGADFWETSEVYDIFLPAY